MTSLVYECYLFFCGEGWSHARTHPSCNADTTINVLADTRNTDAHESPDRTIPHHTTPYRTVPYHTIPHTIPYHTIPYYIPYHTIPNRTFPYHTITITLPYLTIPYHTIPYHTLPYQPYHARPGHAKLCHAMPCHAMPYHTIPYHTIPYHSTYQRPPYYNKLNHAIRSCLNLFRRWSPSPSPLSRRAWLTGDSLMTLTTAASPRSLSKPTHKTCTTCEGQQNLHWQQFFIILNGERRKRDC